jgi:methyltransferase
MVNLADSRVLYTVLVGLVALERSLESVISKRNLARALARGAVLGDSALHRCSVALHAAFLVACPLEVWFLHRPWRPAFGLPMLGLLVLTMALRYWAVWTLGDRWNVLVVCVPGDATVTGGPYRWLRHPNYLAVLLELPALALVHGAWLTAIVFGLGNAGHVAQRIQAEENLLRRHTDYDQAMKDRPSLLPRCP